jgi:hypothetical protein
VATTSTGVTSVPRSVMHTRLVCQLQGQGRDTVYCSNTVQVKIDIQQ